MTDAKKRVLDRLKRQEGQTAGRLARTLGLTVVAVRQHLQALEEQGLVRRETAAPAGRGRPSIRWHLTERASGLYPDRHGDLAVELIGSVREAFGEKGLARLVEARGARQAAAYRALLGDADSLAERLHALAKQRSAEGYMAEVVEEEPGRYLLIEHHCPICEAARECQGLCASELQVFRQVLGPEVRVERVRHLLAGGERCVYRVEG